MPASPARSHRLFDRGARPDVRRVAAVLRTEPVGGALVLGAAVIALVWANSPWSAGYHDIARWHAGPLSLSHWAADGLLAIFFFVAGLELKREFVDGDLRDLRHAALPVSAAVGGMVVPALVYTLIAGRSGASEGWAIPTATDIAFALAVLGIIGTHLPGALRSFLLTLAVVDDLLAITVIAVFYAQTPHLLPLLLAAVAITVFGALVQYGVTRWWLLLPPALAAWGLVHASGIHATVAGVLLAFTVPVRARRGGRDLATAFEHRWRPVSAGFAVPVFAFFAAGVTIADTGGLHTSLTSAITLGIVGALLLGKTVGIAGSAWLVHRFTRARLADGLSWWDIVGLAMLGGVGFTVSLLIGELAFGAGSARDGLAKVGVLTGSVLSALAAAVVLRSRNRRHRARSTDVPGQHG